MATTWSRSLVSTNIRLQASINFFPARRSLPFPPHLRETLLTRVALVKMGHLEATALNEETHGCYYRLFTGRERLLLNEWYLVENLMRLGYIGTPGNVTLFSPVTRS